MFNAFKTAIKSTKLPGMKNVTTFFMAAINIRCCARCEAEVCTSKKKKVFCVVILIFQQEYLLGQGNRKKALEKIGGNQKLVDYSKGHISVPWFLSQSVQLPLALCFFSVKSTRPRCQCLSQVPPVCSALQLKTQNMDFILLTA